MTHKEYVDNLNKWKSHIEELNPTVEDLHAIIINASRMEYEMKMGMFIDHCNDEGICTDCAIDMFIGETDNEEDKKT